jgi:hypothetical protein
MHEYRIILMNQQKKYENGYPLSRNFIPDIKPKQADNGKYNQIRKEYLTGIPEDSFLLSH